MAVCLFDTASGEIVRWETFAVFPRPETYRPGQVLRRLERIVTEWGLRECKAVMIEEQMTNNGKMMQMQGVLSGLLAHNGWMVNTAHLKRTLGVSTGVYRKNKDAAVAMARDVVSNLVQTVPVQRFLALADGQDPCARDSADALLQVVYWLRYLKEAPEDSLFRLASAGHDTQ